MSKELDRLLHLDVTSMGEMCSEDSAYAVRRLEDVVMLVHSLDQVRRANILIDLSDASKACADGVIDTGRLHLEAHGEAQAVRVAIDIVVVRLLRQLAESAR
jgi:ribosome-associated translation inhibitor RaiA